MDLYNMTREELIELVRQLQFSLDETHMVIQKLAKEIPAYRRKLEQEAREQEPPREKLGLKDHLEKHNLFRIYEYIVAADVFNGIEDTIAQENAINTIVEMLEIEGVSVEKDSLNAFFPAGTEQS